MRSRAEAVLRTTAWAALALAAWTAWRGPARAPRRDADQPPGMAQAVRWAAAPPADTIRVALSGLPDDTTRARMAALAGAGIAVTWRDDGVPSLAVEAEFDDATGRGVLRSAGAAAVVEDRAGPLGTLDGLLTVPGLALPVRAGARPTVEHVAPRTAVVLGRPSWEARWVLRALETAGWTVAAGLAIAPGQVMDGPALDTSVVGLVVVLDTLPAARARAVVDFVRSGGGAVFAVAALGAPLLAAIAPGGAGEERRPPASLALPDDRTALAWRPVVRRRADAVALEGDRIVARVEGAGRVVLVGDEETWRLALASDGGRAAHAALWVRLAEAARYRPAAGRDPGDPAPRAALAAAFGAPRDGGGPLVPGLPWEAIIFGIALAALLGEWTSRRLRGAP